MPAFSEEVFRVKKVFSSYPYTYILEDTTEEHQELSGKFYRQELIEAYPGEEITEDQNEQSMETAAPSGDSQ